MSRLDWVPAALLVAGLCYAGLTAVLVCGAVVQFVWGAL